jgi:tetratricopeptide (TPR) repeat protein
MIPVIRNIGLICLLFLPAVLNAQNKPVSKSKKAIDDYNNGLRQYSIPNFDAAEKYFLSAIDADSLFMEAYLVLAEVFEDAGQPLQAIETYRKGLPLNKDYFPYGFVRLGNLEYAEGLYAEASLSYGQFLNLNDKNPQHIERPKMVLFVVLFRSMR